MGGESEDPTRVAREQLANGLLVVRQAAPPAAHTFAATFIAPAGWGYDPPGAQGTARKMASLLSSGAGRRDRVTLARLLDGLGATLGCRTSPETCEVGISGPSDAFDPLLEVLADAVLRPRFDPADLARVQRQLEERQLWEMQQPDGRVEREVLRALFASGHPYRTLGLGERRSLASVGRSELRRFHAGHFPAGACQLIVTSGRGLSEVARDAKSLFRELPEGAGPAAPRLPDPPRRSHASEVEMPGHAQVEIRLAGPSVSRSDPRYPALFLANEVLGGRSLLSRLYQQLREEEGLAYHASSDLEALRWGGYWTVQAGTGPERAERAARLLRKEVERLAREPIPQAELDRIRESAIGELPLALETSGAAHELAVDIGYNGLPDDHLERWPEVLRAVTPEEIQAAAGLGYALAQSVQVAAGPAIRHRTSRR